MIVNWITGKKRREKVQSQISHRILDTNSTAILLIDLQEKLVNVIPNNKSLVSNVKKIVDTSILLNLSIYITEQNPEKLGKTIPVIPSEANYKKYSKSSFSCIECLDLIKDLNKKNIKNILMCGLESHICIFQSAMDLLRSNFNIYIISDAISSRSQNNHQISMARLRDLGAIISTVEMAIFELCRSSKNKNFREISQIIKRSE